MCRDSDENSEESVFEAIGSEVGKKLVRWLKNPLNALTDIGDALTFQGCTNYDDEEEEDS